MNKEKIEKLTDILIELTKQEKEIINEIKEIKEELINAGVKDLKDSYNYNGYYLVYVEPSKSITVDTNRIKKERPDIFKEFSRVTKRKESIRLTKNKGE